MALGNKHLGYKEALNAIEEQSPGSKEAFYSGFLSRAVDRFAPTAEEFPDGSSVTVGVCIQCGAPSGGEVCAFCRLLERAGGSHPDRTYGSGNEDSGVPVTLSPTRGSMADGGTLLEEAP